jgi:gliding motility-associated-like protein
VGRFYCFILILFVFVQESFSQVAFSYSGALCQDNTIIFSNRSIVEVSDVEWDFGDGSLVSTELNPMHIYRDSGSFVVRLVATIKGNGVNDTAWQTIDISLNPTAHFDIDSTTFYHSTYTRIFIDKSDTYNPISKYIWNFGDGSQVVEVDTSAIMYKFKDSGSYPVLFKVVDNRGCVDSVTNIVTVHNRFFVPNVFSPNGDNKNDMFIVTSNGETLFSIEIYSRWGNLVFKRSGYQQIIWDGYMPQGRLVQPGTYYYVINSEDENSTYTEEKGFITVFY